MTDKDNSITKNNTEIDEVCEECKETNEEVKSNLIMHGYKICNSCKTSRTIFPI
tara:strand:- start:272 stop:433 length:162 start_codon:yes stop_codon:yes gene_type:complete